MVEQDFQEGGTQEPIPYVTAEMAWEMSKRAAAEAREDALRESQAQTAYTQPIRNTTQQSQNNIQQPIQNNTQQPIQNKSRDQNRNTQGMDYDDYDDRRGRKKRRRYDDDEEEEDLVGFSPKLVKQLQTTVGVFNTLKDFASNPMQKAIEDRIGGLAAGIIEQAFTGPRGPPPKKDMMDTLLNSQMAFGLGQGLGSRAPELVESLSRSFGKEKAENMIEGMIGKYSGSGGGQRKIEPGDSEPPSTERPRQAPEPPKSEDQSNIELLLSLDPNNPEHVAAYAESQGGISIDVARKMLMIHQDDIIKRMKSQGADTTVIESQRGSRVGQDNPSQHAQPSQQQNDRQNEPVHRVNVASDYQSPAPVQQVPPPTQNQIHQTFPSQPIPPIQQNIPNDMSVDMEYTEPNIGSDFQQPGQEYTEYKDLRQQEKNSSYSNESSSNDKQAEMMQQTEMMKVFADDIGKVMGDVIGKIESLNNTVFNLQNELNIVKSQKVQEVRTLPTDNRTSKDFFPSDFEKELDSTILKQDMDIYPKDLDIYPKDMNINSSTHMAHLDESNLLKDIENINLSKDILKDDAKDHKSSSSEHFKGFFPEKAQNIHDFEKELAEETKRSNQLNRQDTGKSPKEDIDISLPKVEIEVDTKVDISKIDDSKISKVDTSKEDGKTNEKIIKKPIKSMVNKKKITYALKQKDDVHNKTNKNDEKQNDDNINNEKHNSSNKTTNENNEIDNENNNKIDIDNNIDKMANKAE